MEVYLVGGAVRDELLGIKAKERDWLVVGATVEECLERGWRQVAPEVPVFKDPETGDEYAMARTERKTGVGYRGFDFDYGPHISLEDDLQRRDLTINALAKGQNGDLVDPGGFAGDIKARLLRHITPRFTEDPVRVVRLCSLYARLRKSGFAIVPTTVQLIRTMTSAAEAKEEFASISPVQLWTQLEKALGSETPEAFIEMLNRTESANLVLPEALTTPAAIARLKSARASHDSPLCRLAVWVCPLDPADKEQFMARYEAPKAYRRFCEQVDTLYPFYVAACDKPIPDILELFKSLDAFSNSEAFEEQVNCCHDIYDQSESTPNVPQVQKHFLTTMLHCAMRIDRSRILRRNIEGTPRMAIEIDKHRCAEMARVRRYYPWSDLSVGANRPE